jgi:hypothetical protein
MNQPHGSCSSYFHELVEMSSLSRRRRRRRIHQDKRSYIKTHDQPQGFDPVPVMDNSVDYNCLTTDFEGVHDGIEIDPAHEGTPGAVCGEPLKFVEEFPGASKIFGNGHTFMDSFRSDRHGDKRIDNLYYPFASRDEWELASFLSRSNLSMTSTDQFLSLQLVSNRHHPYLFCYLYSLQIQRLHLSFRTAKQLRGRVEMLPQGPKWTYKLWKTVYHTKTAVQLFYRDAVECIQALLHNPLVQDYLHFTPLRVFKTAEKLMRVYSEWRTGDAAWNMQACK